MEQELLDRFPEIWGRVHPGPHEPPGPGPQAPPPGPPRPHGPACSPDEAALRMFLGDLSAAEAGYLRMRKLVSRRDLREIFSRLADEAARDRRMLQSAYFLLTGDTCPSRLPPVRDLSPLSLARRLLLAARETAAALRRASRDTRDADLARLYGELARSRDRAARQLRAAADRMLR